MFFSLLVRHIVNLMVCTLENTNTPNAVYEKRVYAMNMDFELLHLADKYHLEANRNLGAKNCGFRCAWDTSGCRIPDANGVLVYPLRRLSYQN